MVKRILIAEDEKPLARALELKLTHAGFTVQVVNNGADALTSIAAGPPFDLMLLDLIMPKVDGFTVLQTLHDQRATVPVIVLSNLSQEEDAKKAKRLGAKEFFVKSNTPIASIVTYIHQLFTTV